MRCRYDMIWIDMIWYDMIWYVTICHQLFSCDLWFGSWCSKVLNMVLSSVLGPQFRYYVWDGLNPQASTGTVGQYRPFFTAGLLRDLVVSPLPSLIETVILLLLDPRIHQGSSQIIQNHLEGHFKDLFEDSHIFVVETCGNPWKHLFPLETPLETPVKTIRDLPRPQPPWIPPRQVLRPAARMASRCDGLQFCTKLLDSK